MQALLSKLKSKESQKRDEELTLMKNMFEVLIDMEALQRFLVRQEKALATSASLPQSSKAQPVVAEATKTTQATKATVTSAENVAKKSLPQTSGVNQGEGEQSSQSKTNGSMLMQTGGAFSGSIISDSPPVKKPRFTD